MQREAVSSFIQAIQGEYTKSITYYSWLFEQKTSKFNVLRGELHISNLDAAILQPNKYNPNSIKPIIDLDEEIRSINARVENNAILLRGVVDFLNKHWCGKCQNAVWRKPLMPPRGFVTEEKYKDLLRENHNSYSLWGHVIRPDCKLHLDCILCGWEECDEFIVYTGKNASPEDRAKRDTENWRKKVHAQL